MEKYFVQHEDYMGDDWKEFTGHSHYSAALEYAEYYNTRCDYVLMGESIEILVKDSKGEVIKYSVGAEPSVDYSATEI